jgi:hypothetical protein
MCVTLCVIWVLYCRLQANEFDEAGNIMKLCICSGVCEEQTKLQTTLFELEETVYGRHSSTGNAFNMPG